MEIVYAAEKDSIASLLSERLSSKFAPEQIRVSENPNETGSFLIDTQMQRFLLSPSGELIRGILTD